MDFRIVRKGYDTKETDDYILKITKEYEEELEKQKALILTLKDALVQMKGKVDELESKKQMVSSALVRAVEKAEETERIAKQKLDTEIAQLKTFHIRWTSYYKRLIQKYPMDDELKKAEEFTQKINGIFSSPSSEDISALEEFRRDHAKVMGIKPQSSPKPASAYEFGRKSDEEYDIESLLADIESDV